MASLEASEALHTMKVLQIGTGAVGKDGRDDAQAQVSEWRRAATRGRPRRRRQSKTQQALTAQALGMHVGAPQPKERADA